MPFCEAVRLNTRAGQRRPVMPASQAGLPSLANLDGLADLAGHDSVRLHARSNYIVTPAAPHQASGPTVAELPRSRAAAGTPEPPPFWRPLPLPHTHPSFIEIGLCGLGSLWGGSGIIGGETAGCLAVMAKIAQ